MRFEKKHIFGLSVIAMSMAYGGWVLKDAFVPAFRNFDEAMSADGTLELRGFMVKGSRATVAGGIPTFRLADDKGIQVAVLLASVPPAGFENADRLGVRGQFQNETFHAHQIIMK